MEIIPKKCLPACDFRCNRAQELDLECETCPGRNEEKPMPGGGELPRWRLVLKMEFGNLIRPWRDSKVNLDVISGLCYWEYGRAWIQFERNGIS